MCWVVLGLVTFLTLRAYKVYLHVHIVPHEVRASVADKGWNDGFEVGEVVMSESVLK